MNYVNQIGLAARKLIEAAIALIILIYFAVRTPSPKIIFVPFLICCIASVGKNLGLLFNKTKIAWVFDRVFKWVFFLSWFAFLAVACYIAVRDKNYTMLIFSIPFWIAGVFFAKRKLINKTD